MPKGPTCGTTRGYNAGCRCQPCRDAHSVANRAWYGRHRETAREQARLYWRNNHRASLVADARKRARLAGVPCTITPDDLCIPDVCPILGIPLAMSTGRPGPGSPSLDRIIPELGYVPGNVQVISYKANTMKQNATPAELLRFADWIYKTMGGESVA